MIPIIIISIIAILGLIIPLLIKSEIKIKSFSLHTYWIIPLICSLILLIFGLVKWDDAASFMTSNEGINPLQILALFFSMAFISIVLDEAGFFTFLASRVVSKAKGSQFVVFILVYLLTSVLTVFTSNDIVILTFTPFLIYFAKRAKINPIPYLVAEFVAANTWSILFIIGNPTNIYLGESFNLTFVSYFLKMWPSALFAGLSSFGIMIALFSKKLKEPIQAESMVSELKDKTITIASLVCLFGCLITMIVSSFVDIPLWLISVISAAVLLAFLLIYCAIRKDFIIFKSSLVRLPYNLIPFLLSMFIIVLGLKTSGVTDTLNNWLTVGDSIWSFGAASFFSSNLVNNIPMSVLFAEIIRSGAENMNAVYSSIIGSNIGAILSPFGALAGIMWISILKHNEIKFSFFDFIKYGAIISIPSMVFALLGLYLF